tara:strand:- start:27089 stop:27847 length:759 start_codon:yes stop_codon:yes gene_type:complete
MQFSIIIQARLGSQRLPGKILKNYKKYNLLDVLIKRLRRSKKVKNIIVATTKMKEDDKIKEYCNLNSILYHRGPKNNVLRRYYETAKKFKVKNIVRITSDCPFIDNKILDFMINLFNKKKIDYLSNTYPEPSTYPDGMDIEIFTFKALKLANKYSIKKSEKEHVTVYIRRSGRFKTYRTDLSKDKSKYRLTVDHPNDFVLFKKIINKFTSRIYTVGMNEIINFLEKNPKFIKYQKKILRNEKFIYDLKRDKI